MANSTALGPTMEMAVGHGQHDRLSRRRAADLYRPLLHGPDRRLQRRRGGADRARPSPRAPGAGQHVEVPQVEAAMHYVGPEMLHAIASRHATRSAAATASTWAAPHDSFPAHGEDEWVAIAVTEERHWAALRGVIGDPRLDAPDFATLAGAAARRRTRSARSSAPGPAARPSSRRRRRCRPRACRRRRCRRPTTRWPAPISPRAASSP